MLSTYERQNTPEIALKIAEKTCESFNLRRDIYSYGEELKTYHCRLTDHHNQMFYGCGKGLNIQSKISASFEALEHYAVYRFCQIISNDLNNYHFLNEPLKLNAFTANLKSAQKIPMTMIQNIITKEDLYYPLYLIDPRYSNHPNPMDTFDYQPYSWNVCDSGIASGTSWEEASLHALNESIERDAYSLFLIKTFILKQKIRIVKKNSTTAHLQKIINYIEQKYFEKLLIVDITSDINVPTFLVSMTRQPMAIQPMGCGTSLNKEYALERALLECLQPLHIYNEHLAKNQKQILDNFVTTPLLAQCAKMDLQLLQNNFQYSDFQSLPSDQSKKNVTVQLETIIKKIRSKGFSIYSMNIAKMDSGFHCVKYIIPEFEQFYLVEIGKFILPNKRGMALIENYIPS